MKVYVSGYEKVSIASRKLEELRIWFSKDPEWTMKDGIDALLEYAEICQTRIANKSHQCNFDIEELPNGRYAIFCEDHPELPTWSRWQSFPDPHKRELLLAPFGAGCYQLRHRSDGRLILFGSSGNCAYRMSSLLPHPEGCGHRRNDGRREYILQNLTDVEFRTLPCANAQEAIECEWDLERNREAYIYHT